MKSSSPNLNPAPSWHPRTTLALWLVCATPAPAQDAALVPTLPPADHSIAVPASVDTANGTSSAGSGEWKPPPDCKLVGYATVPRKRVAVLLRDVPGQEPQCITLAEGQKLGDLELIKINEKEKTVQIRNRDVIVHLTFPSSGSAPTEFRRYSLAQQAVATTNPAK